MANPDERYRRWLDDEAQARRLDDRRRAARRRCDEALHAPLDSPAGAPANRIARLTELERALESSFAFYLSHSANDDGFLENAFGRERAAELAERLARRKVSLLTELDRVRETRARLAAEEAAG